MKFSLKKTKEEKKPTLKKESFLFRGKFSQTEKIIFFRNLATMISSGISVVEALEIAVDQVKSRFVKRAILKMAEDTRNGMKLSKSMSRFPHYFPEYLVETIEMGDVSGKLTETLNKIADDIEKDEALKRKVMSAILYPIVVFFLMVAVVILFAFYVLPNIAQLYREIGAPLPLPTKIILDSAEFLRQNFWLVLGTILAILIFLFLMLKIKKGRYLIHYLMLRLPLIGQLIKEYNLILIFRSLQMLFSSGISLNAAVKIAKKTTTNDVFQEALASIEPKIIHGVPFSKAISPFPFLFSKQAQKIIWVGEKTGKIDESFNWLTEYFEKMTDYRVRILTVMLEPILMIFVGICVGGLALSIFMPIYGMVKVI